MDFQPSKRHSVNELVKMMQVADRQMTAGKMKMDYAVQELVSRRQDVVQQLENLEATLKTIDNATRQKDGLDVAEGPPTHRKTSSKF